MQGIAATAVMVMVMLHSKTVPVQQCFLGVRNMNQ